MSAWTPSPVDLAQPILVRPAKASVFLTVTLADGPTGPVLDAIADVAALVRSVGFREPENDLTCVVGIGAQAYDRLYDAPRPPGLHPLPALQGAKHAMPSTPGDLLFHIRCATADMCFELERRILARFDGLVGDPDEVRGFRYWDDRDLLGFVDGTENPDGLSAVRSVLVDDDTGWTGSSYVVVQKYLHDLQAWDSLTVEQQELVIGRTKLDDIELPDAVQPSNSHLSATTIEDPDGTQHQIVRDNLPFGSPAHQEFGTYFIGYSADPDVTETMLRRMFIGEPEGNYDRILDFSTAVTGCLFLVPPAAFLQDPGALLHGTGPDQAPDPTSRAVDPHDAKVVADAAGG